MERVRYMISDAANLIQVESHVLRYWEEELELDVPRNEMGHRYYTEENIRQFEQIKRLKAEGFQLKAIKMLIHNPSGGEDEPVGIHGGQAGEDRPDEFYRGPAGGRLSDGYQGGQSGGERTVDFRGGQIRLDMPACMNEGQNGESRSAGVRGRQPEAEMEFPGTANSGTAEISSVEAKDVSNVQGEPLSSLEQFQLMMNDIVCAAISRNNQALGQEIGTQVEEKVIKEMNYLMREREEREEERFRRLDETIRKRQRRTVKENKKQKRKFLHTPIHKAEEMG